MRLTDAGRLLAERAEEIIGRLDAAEAELAAHVGLREGRVRLAAFPSALGTIVPAAAARLEAETPGMDLMLTEAEPPEALSSAVADRSTGAELPAFAMLAFSCGSRVTGPPWSAPDTSTDVNGPQLPAASRART